ncbi:MAG: putative Ig domain-containing protein, partial [Bacteroidetes bacterium]|nr:putative Ig domain-containing protein [Bacteroidota bacterium]
GSVDSNNATISITVNEVNDPPVLDPIGNKSVDELANLTFTATATDPDSSLTYSLTGAPTGATIASDTGVFNWTPTEAQGPGDYTLTVEVTDGNTIDSEEITITVNEVNSDPVAQDDSVSTDEDTIKPITLNFVTNLFIKNKTLPSSRKEIYEEGLKLLIEEQNPSRKESKLLKRHSNAQKLIVAQRIASIMILCNKSSICLDRNIKNINETDIFIDEIIGGMEVIGQTEVTITEELIKDTLNTGLFVLNNVNKLGWFHQTFTEFLTARYLFIRELQEEQLLNILFQDIDGEKKAIPQLNETIGWVVTFYPSLFATIVDHDVEVLLNSDVTLQDDKSKERLIDNLLRLFEEQRLYDLKFSFKQSYHKLRHPNIINQLRKVINNKNQNSITKNVAVDIAESCKVIELQSDLLKIFLNKKDSINIRNNVGWALKRVADKNHICKMREVLFSDLVEDVDDELRGICLISLWPDFISIKELFSVLNKPKNSHFSGNYVMFLMDLRLEHIKSNDILFALEWVTKQDSKHNLVMHRSADIIDNVMFKAWQYINDECILNAYKDAVIHLINNYDDIITGKLANEFYQLYEQDDYNRRRLITAILNSFNDPIKEYSKFYLPTRRIIFFKDFIWMLNQSILEKNEDRKKAWVDLSRSYFDNSNTEHINKLIEKSSDESIIYDEFKFLLKPIVINSEEAIKEKRNYNKYFKPRNLEDKRNLYRLSYKENLLKLLTKLKDGEIEILWHLYLFLCSNPERKSQVSEINSDVTCYPGWKILIDEDKNLIISSSKKYLIDIDPKNDDWFGTNNFHRPAMAGYKIIRLLINSDYNFINTFQKEVFIKWAPIIVAYPVSYGLDKGDYPQKIVQIFYDRIPQEMLVLFRKQLDYETDRDEIVWIPKKFEYCWDDKIEKVLFNKLQDKNLLPNCFSSIVSDLQERKYNPIYDFLLAKLNLPFSNEVNEYRKILISSEFLLYFYYRKVWSSIWVLINNNLEFGKELFLKIAYDRNNRKNFLTETTEDELADLFIWLAKNFPFEEDDEPRDAHFIGPREELKYFKNDVINLLKERGTNAAQLSIQKIKKAFPHLDWINYVLYESKVISRYKSWIPPTPVELLFLLEDKSKRLIKNESELVILIIESLNRLEKEMHGVSTPVNFIWNSKPITPKSENELSDFIKIHLQRDLKNTIINREVEIRPTRGNIKGENTDLLIQTFTSSEKVSDLISVIIEVKGSWNPKLKTDMETQLLNRYLKNNQCKNGIYLVGWFLCDSWDKNDYRIKNNPKIKIEDVRQLFYKQTESLTRKSYSLHSFVLDCRL